MSIMAFSRWEGVPWDGHFDIWARDSDKSFGLDAPVRLTNGPGTNHDPSMSPSGDKIAFTRDFHIHKMRIRRLDSFEPVESIEQLTFGPDLDFHPQFSPDGEKIAFTRAEPGTPRPWLRGGSLWVMNSDGTDPRRLVNDPICRKPSWSPNGRRIAYGNGSTIYIYDTRTDETRPISGSFFDEEPAWSTYGIAFMHAGVGHGELWVMSPDGSNRRRLAGPPPGSYVFYRDPSWGPDDRIAFTRVPYSAADSADIWSVPFSNGEDPAPEAAPYNWFSRGDWWQQPSWQPRMLRSVTTTLQELTTINPDAIRRLLVGKLIPGGG